MPQDRMDVDGDEPRRSSRNRTMKYASLDPEYMTNVDVIRNRHEVDNSINNSSVMGSPAKRNSSNSPSRLRSGDLKQLECSRDGGDEASGDDDEEEDESYVAGEEEDENDDDDDVEEDEESDDFEANDEEEDSRQRSERTPPRRSSRSSRSLRSSLREESPFFDHGHHVHFSPSSKPGSPAVRRNLRRRDSSALRATRLHNLTSEDEEREFERRYSRDLRSRKRKEQGAVASKSSGSGEEEGKEQSQKSSDQESPRATRRSSRNLDKSNKIAKEDLSDESSDDDAETQKEEEDKSKKNATKQENGEEEEEDAASASDISGLRRSKRIHKSLSEQALEHHDGDDDETEEDDDDDDNEEEETPRRSSRRLSRRNRVPVTRLMYEPSPRIASSSRRSTELRNLDQYSTDEEYEASGTVSRRRNGRYNMRENRRAISRYEEKGIPTVATKNTRRNFGGSSRRELR